MDLFRLFAFYYLGKDGEPHRARTAEEFYAAMMDGQGVSTQVAKATIDEAEVSTVFLSFDHGFGRGPPVLWETMIFGGPLDRYQDRCAGSREQALAMHEKACELVRAALAEQEKEKQPNDRSLPQS